MYIKVLKRIIWKMFFTCQDEETPKQINQDGNQTLKHNKTLFFSVWILAEFSKLKGVTLSVRLTYPTNIKDYVQSDWVERWDIWKSQSFLSHLKLSWNKQHNMNLINHVVHVWQKRPWLNFIQCLQKYEQKEHIMMLCLIKTTTAEINWIKFLNTKRQQFIIYF